MIFVMNTDVIAAVVTAIHDKLYLLISEDVEFSDGFTNSFTPGLPETTKLLQNFQNSVMMAKI